LQYSILFFPLLPLSSSLFFSLFVRVVQRIPRYTLLLGDLLSKTPDDHPDAKILRSCTDEISRVAAYLDKNMAESANNKRMLDIGSKLRTDNAPDLLRAHRKLLCETVTTATCELLGVARQNSFSGVRKLRLVLFNDILVHVSESKGESSLGDAKHHWPLNLVWIQLLESAEKGVYMCIFIFCTCGKVWPCAGCFFFFFFIFLFCFHLSLSLSSVCLVFPDRSSTLLLLFLVDVHIGLFQLLSHIARRVSFRLLSVVCSVHTGVDWPR
jgi:RhoGEF domain